MTERELMDSGGWYLADDPELRGLRAEAERRCLALNSMPCGEEGRDALLRELLGSVGEGVEILPPIWTDYGSNCSIGDRTFINRGVFLMDCAPITIGRHCFIGPGCSLYTAAHPLFAEDRDRGLEIAMPIVLGDHVWLGGNVVILPGVTIGDGAVIGAGSVVSRSIPEGVVATGSPCRAIRPITDADRASRIVARNSQF